ncbi:hypothetical protein G5B38_15230 [Pseudohalocynthiibacter aestuariivivens]|nr:hypothetical protein [Pseudohalocynthiibacter aestuariivivens]QIE46766.1 hypothetical protein G5B38_15230 [Pseudohalocynthiibacter aestuariivivens]
MHSWSDIRDGIEALARMDRTFQVFGARQHRYRIGPSLSDDAIAAWEATQRCAMPVPLRAAYQTLGTAGVGPHYGLHPPHLIRLHRPADPFRSGTTLMELARARDPGEGAADDHPDIDYIFSAEDDWSVPDHALTGLAVILNAGCETELAIVTAGPEAGSCVWLTTGVRPSPAPPLITLFTEWVATETANFACIAALLDTAPSAAALRDAAVAQRGLYRALDYMVSALGIDKPADLFGETENRFHGATQLPWFEAQFAASKNLR